MMKRQLVAAGALAMVMASSGAGWTSTFREFTSVDDVCPECPKRATDTVTLNTNRKIQARVVAENQDFFVLQRYGEVRALPKREMQSVEWGNGAAPGGLTSQDQIVLRSGHVFTGSIIEENPQLGLYRLQSSVDRQTFVVFKNAVASIYRAGQKIE